MDSMIIPPSTAKARLNTKLVTTGSSALRATCLSRTSLSGRPLALAAITKSSRMVSSILFRVSSMVPAKLIKVSVPTGRTICLTMSQARYPMPDASQTAIIASTVTGIQARRTNFVLRPLHLAVTRITMRTAIEATVAVTIILRKTELASTVASLQSTGSRNLPMGNHPALNENSQIIMSANHGVKTV